MMGFCKLLTFGCLILGTTIFGGLELMLGLGLIGLLVGLGVFLLVIELWFGSVAMTLDLERVYARQSWSSRHQAYAAQHRTPKTAQKPKPNNYEKQSQPSSLQFNSYK